MAAMRAAGREDGVATLELVGLLPVVLISLMLFVQLVIGVHTVQATNDAARQAARAYSLGRDPQAAAENSLPTGLRVARLDTFGPDHGATVQVDVPLVSRFMPQWHVTRTAVMP